MKKSILLSILILSLFQVSLLAQSHFQANLVELKENEKAELNKVFSDFKTVRLDTRTLNAICQQKQGGIKFN